ncbi:MAG: glycosyltransferase family 2 protein [Hydrogenophilaceae bacterium]|nr:glycosyltransferase family 2 protein [Hydrogenophilaceae bacterium]
MSGTWIVIVNFRTADLVVDCLRSLAPQVDDLGGGRVVVVDNASGDRSVETISDAIEQQRWSVWAGIVPLDHNGGFAFGNNAGIRLAMSEPNPPDYVMLLNPDTVTRPEAIRALVRFMDAHPEAGIAGSLLETAEGGVDCSAHRVHSPLSELDGGARLGVLSRLLRQHVVSPPIPAQAHRCDWVSGASMIVRRSVIEKIGLMDDGYFLYYEEVDYCLRAKQAGWEVWYAPQSRVLHLEGAATGIKAAARRRAAYWYDSRRRFFIKHYGIAGLLLADLLWALGRVSLLLRSGLGLGGKGIERDPIRYMPDLIGGDLRAIFTGRAGAIKREPGL